MLIRRMLEILSELVKEYGLVVNVTLVKLNQNKMDRITKIQQVMKNEAKAELLLLVR